MSFKIDFIEGDVVRWTLTETGVDVERDPAYTPTLFADVRDGNREKLERLRHRLRDDPKVVDTGWEDWFTSLRDGQPREVLRIGLERVHEIRNLTREIRTVHEQGQAPGTFELYNTDFSPQFRYCLETGTDPTPTREPSVLRLDLPEDALAEQDLSRLRIDENPVHGGAETVLRVLHHRIRDADPDVLLVSTADLVPVLSNEAAAHGVDAFQLGRLPGLQQLAGESEMQTYGRILHSPARYNVPGRAIIDLSNSFLWGQSGLHGLIDLVERSWKPMQEAGWASIGNVLTAIQIREALDRDVLIPNSKTQHEAFKTVETLHEADRGGFIFEPAVGVHEHVEELDFSSLYPNIMIRHNISPETVLCDCHPNRDDVPVLGYGVCPDPGFIPDVLAPIVADRDEIKTRIRESEAPETRERLESVSEALKWILVTCFGYQGYKNSKFGRIEAHESINAYARDILLTAKERFEAHGWQVVHGIVDSIWVEPNPERDQTAIETVAAEISDAVGIRLEHEARYDWIGFVPKRDSNAGALTRYFGSVHGADTYKVRGIELRQRSTPDFLETAQTRFIDILDGGGSPEEVGDQCQRYVQMLNARRVDPENLVVRQRVSKPLEGYERESRNVSALTRYRDHGIEKAPGEDVRYVVVDDAARRIGERVKLHFEDIQEYDAEYYTTELIRACESILSPLGWDRTDIRQYMANHRDGNLNTYR